MAIKLAPGFISDTEKLPPLPPKPPMTGDPYLDRYNYGQQQIIRDALERLAQSAKEC